MVDTELLRKKIDESGLKLNFIAEKCGLTYQGLSNKLNNARAFKTSEAGILKDLLQLSSDEFESIFFASTVANTATK